MCVSFSCVLLSSLLAKIALSLSLAGISCVKPKTHEKLFVLPFKNQYTKSLYVYIRLCLYICMCNRVSSVRIDLKRNKKLSWVTHDQVTLFFPFLSLSSLSLFLSFREKRVRHSVKNSNPTVKQLKQWKKYRFEHTRNENWSQLYFQRDTQAKKITVSFFFQHYITVCVLSRKISKSFEVWNWITK